MFYITKNPKDDGCQRGLVSIVCKIFDKNFTAMRPNTSDDAIKSDIISNQQLAEELSESIIRKFKKRKLYPSFKDNI